MHTPVTLASTFIGFFTLFNVLTAVGVNNNNSFKEMGEMAQQLRAMNAFPEGPGFNS